MQTYIYQAYSIRTKAMLVLSATALVMFWGCSKLYEDSHNLANNTLTAEETEQGWQLLFDGTNLSEYQIFGNPNADLDRWKIVGRTLSLRPRAEGSTSKVDLVITPQPVRDFEFSFEWLMSKGGNGGIFYMVKDDPKYEKPWHTGLEMQLLDNAGHEEGLITTHRSGDLYDLIASKSDTTNLAGEWNKLVSDSKYPEWPEYAKIDRGHIILQDHGDQIWFRNIKIRELK